ncbi:MAG: molecular chaperone HtpG [Gordonia sp.]|uniref:molecular chaperone HtpG n=1 Tax=Williamsia sp. 1138 TaxID=1903117 RepID=UPI000A102F45|nr:molecular chaperone HtpG [Williamsia sp. 1138]MBA4023439.1 molecular chaperone HtpG [Gordonia sp. (in: high G+C Gram-positive bacteria)]OZG30209.1 molecular chaperone HtpG [Williamsia sp. 1138]
MSAQVEEMEFAAETRQLLDLMIHSVYSNKDSFLRELVSNSSDALDKLRMETYRNKDLAADTSDLHIQITLDPEARTFTLSDNGIGMSRAEVVDLIGTLAKSGTAEVRKKLKEAKDSAASEELIGQFGIGFYSTFMVADKVTLLTRKAGEEQATRWESAGEGTYTIEDVADAPQGTTVTLHLKPEDAEDDLHDYASVSQIRQLVKKYSDFISWPIRMDVPAPPAPPAPEADEDADAETAEETEPAPTHVTETLNSQKALWTRPRSEVTDEEYAEFYRHVSHAWDDPLEIIPMKAEGTFEYQALLFIPSTAPFDLFMREHKAGVQLYVKRVFIMDDCEELMPEYLRFIKGLVDAQDLSLNVSREILQQDRQIKAIRRRLTKKVLSVIKDLRANDREKYDTLWSQYGRVLKEGLLQDVDNRDALLAITSLSSTHSADTATSLAEYVERMKDTQSQIFYATGESREQIERSPHLEAFKAKGLEVLLLTDPIDEMWIQSIPDFEGKPLQSVAKGEVDLSDEADKEDDEKKDNEQFAELLTWLTGVLVDDVSQVRLSSRLTDSAACIVGEAQSLSPALEKMYRDSGIPMPESKRILELNPDHALTSGLQKAFADRGDDAALRETAELLYGAALLAEGGSPTQPAAFSKTLANLLTRTVSAG